VTVVLRWPLEITPAGKLALAVSEAEIWDLRLRSLLSTRKGERAMRTSYGCFLPERLFATFSPTNPEDDIRLAVSQWLPLLTVNSVKIEERLERSAYGQPDTVFHVHVDYTTPSRERLQSTLAVAGGSDQ
jgi:phage baseplate assembly protein W